MANVIIVVITFAAIVCIKCTYSIECDPEATVCEFRLVIQETLTMQHHEYGLLKPHDGQIYAYNDFNYSRPIKDGFIQGDGFWDNTRRVMAVNGSIPGPSIIVYENQQVVIYVTNHLETEGLVMHWHGLHQLNSSYMDGVPMISQCPILPHQTFPYRFLAFPEGTHWYHSHYSVQRTMGVYGAFIVRRKNHANLDNYSEHIMQLAEWTHEYDSVTAHLKALAGLFVGSAAYNLSSSIDGSIFGPSRFQSGLINGRGRYWSSPGIHNGAPLEVFNVKSASRNVFRVIGAMSLYPFRVSVDEHKLSIVSADGFDVEPELVDFFLIYPGERVDFVLEAKAKVDNYWIRAETLEVNVAPRHIAEAVLHYSGAPELKGSYENVVSRSAVCTKESPCKVLNCPFFNHPVEENMVCVPFTSLKSSLEEAPVTEDKPYKEVFLNVAMSPGKAHRASINWHSFSPPTTLGYGSREGFVSCPEEHCNSSKEGPCHCTHTLDFDYQKVYQLVFTNMGQKRTRAMHPMHMHGHTFQVIKVGFGAYNTTTGKLTADNPDIACNDELCSKPSWSDKTRMNYTLAIADFTRSVQKDTIIVPSGGYVIIRVRASNPGLWYVHCHIDEHQMEGMALLIDSAPAKRPPLPHGFPQCHPFTGKEPLTVILPCPSSTTATIAIIVLSFVCSITTSALTSIACWLLRGRSTQRHARVESIPSI